MSKTVALTRRRARAVYNRLAKGDAPFRPKPRQPILDELVMTILSQHTSDVNTARAFASLRDRFGRWQAVQDADLSDVAGAIRSGGLADQKAPRIQAILDEIEAREGRLDLSRLNDLSDAEVEAYLTSLPGVGPKTAACVLCFAMGRAAFPVDTHVHRVALRLGWIPAKTSADAAHRLLTPRIPEDIRYPLHVALIRHGRTVCVARAPRCTECVLFDLCDAGSDLVSAGEAR